MENVPNVGDTWVSVSEGLVSGSLTPDSALKKVRQSSKESK
jgi:raffinose/stachyose/melibiose transport system substrate-binding protein